LSLYLKLLEEVKKNRIDYEKLEVILERIKGEIEKGKFPSKEEYLLFEGALKIVDAKHSVLGERIKEFRKRKEVSRKYGQF
jgi:hypothetical protein